jgi:signal transduction histidine kinase
VAEAAPDPEGPQRSRDFLRAFPLFADLSDEDLDRVGDMVDELHLDAGEVLFEEGDIADRAYILRSGELEVVKQVDGREIPVDVQTMPGTVVGEMALLEETPRLATVRAGRDSELLSLDQEVVAGLMHASPTAARNMLHTLTRRWRGLEGRVHHDERMAQLGTLTAGIAHELNNPVAAVVRSAEELGAGLDAAERARVALEALDLEPAQREAVERLGDRLWEAVSSPPVLSTLARNDLEERLEEWLDERDIDEPWELLPALVDLGMDAAGLEELAAGLTEDQLQVVLRWLARAHGVRSQLAEISHGSRRVSEIVSALKSYAYLDQAPVQDVDVHRGLDDTLVILRGAIPTGVTVEREYAEQLPGVTAYGSELNQVWTNLIDNALDAVDGEGTIQVRTRVEAGEVVVEVEDDGPGIAPADVPKLFDPFFTTKPPGKGTGLGLNVSHRIVVRHRGRIEVDSQPGRTVFRVFLPVEPTASPPSVDM